MHKVKGRIVEIHEQVMLVLTSEGEFLERPVPQGNFQIGDEVRVVPSGSANIFGPVASVASVAAVIGFLLFQSISTMAAPAYFVHVDIDNPGTPSIELAISKNLRVVGAEPLNAEGNKILNEAGLKRESVQSAINDLMRAAEDLEYIGPEKDNTLLVSIAGNNNETDKSNKKKVISKRICTAARIQLEAAKTSATLGVATVDSSTRQQAQNNKASINSMLKQQAQGTKELPKEYEVSRIIPGQTKKSAITQKGSRNWDKKSYSNEYKIGDKTKMYIPSRGKQNQSKESGWVEDKPGKGYSQKQSNQGNKGNNNNKDNKDKNDNNDNKNNEVNKNHNDNKNDNKNYNMNKNNKDSHKIQDSKGHEDSKGNDHLRDTLPNRGDRNYRGDRNTWGNGDAGVTKDYKDYRGNQNNQGHHGY